MIDLELGQNICWSEILSDVWFEKWLQSFFDPIVPFNANQMTLNLSFPTLSLKTFFLD